MRKYFLSEAKKVLRHNANLRNQISIQKVGIKRDKKTYEKGGAHQAWRSVTPGLVAR